MHTLVPGMSLQAAAPPPQGAAAGADGPAAVAKVAATDTCQSDMMYLICVGLWLSSSGAYRFLYVLLSLCVRRCRATPLGLLGMPCLQRPRRWLSRDKERVIQMVGECRNVQYLAFMSITVASMTKLSRIGRCRRSSPRKTLALGDIRAGASSRGRCGKGPCQHPRPRTPSL